MQQLRSQKKNWRKLNLNELNSEKYLLELFVVVDKIVE